MRIEQKTKVIMTTAAHEALQKRLQKALSDHEGYLKGMGDAAEDDWHGNGVYDLLLHSVYTSEAQASFLLSALRATQIITSRKETDEIDIGNEV